MKKILLLLSIGLLCSLPAGAEIYKWVAPDGSTFYSDKPQPGGRALEAVPIQIYHAPPFNDPFATDEVVDDDDDDKYDSLKIVSPADDQPIRANDGSVTVQIAIQPALRIQHGHRIGISLDGKEMPGAGSGLSIQLTGLNRGTHQVQARVMNRSGRSLLSSSSSSFHVLRSGR